MKLHTYEWGDPESPLVVCLHGVTGHGLRFRKLAEERLANRFHVVAADLRGHGHSTWDEPWDLATHVADLLETFETLQPGPTAYSPLSFFFNFSHNVMKGQIVDSLVWSLPWPVGLNDLFTAAPREEAPERSRETLARTLTAYARTHPHKIRGRLMPVIVYDPEAGYRAFRLALRRLRE